MAEKKKQTKKTVSPQKIVIEGNFVDVIGTGKFHSLKKGAEFNITKEKAELLIAKGWVEIAK